MNFRNDGAVRCGEKRLYRVNRENSRSVFRKSRNIRRKYKTAVRSRIRRQKRASRGGREQSRKCFSKNSLVRLSLSSRQLSFLQRQFRTDARSLCRFESLKNVIFLDRKAGLGNLSSKNRLLDRFLFLSSKSRQVSLNRLFQGCFSDRKAEKGQK